jgi:hypothetical protein
VRVTAFMTVRPDITSLRVEGPETAEIARELNASERAFSRDAGGLNDILTGDYRKQ